MGECRRYPPTVVLVQVIRPSKIAQLAPDSPTQIPGAAFPPTNALAFCGEFEAADPPKGAA